MKLIPSILYIFLLASCNGGGGSSSTPGSPASAASPSAGSGSCTAVDLPAPSDSTGQLNFTLDSSLDPCSITGYVVGFQDDLKVKEAKDGSYFISNIPAGDHDVIVTGSLIVSGFWFDSKKDKAVRLSKQSFLAGVRKEKGKLELPDVGSISGKVTLSGRTDHAGIHVYIPGTSFDATTDTDGSYTISPYVPSGVNNLFFEKDGYHRGQIEDIKVLAGADTKALDIQLVLSTGAKGFVIIDSGEEISSSKNVTLTIGSTSDAVLMKISENQAFVGADWEPVITRKAYDFSSFGDKTLYIKFANENGLESTTYQDSITLVDYAQASTFAINAGAAYTNSSQVTLNLNAPGAAKVYASNTVGCASGGAWTSYSSSLSWTIAQSNATATVYLKFLDKVGNESACLSDSIIHDDILPIANSISINSGAAFTNSSNVPLILSATGASDMNVSNSAGCASGGSWEAYGASKSWTLGQANATATVYVKFKDLAGNESSCISASIIHDDIPPGGTSISINGGAGYVTATNVALSLAATDTNAIQMYITNTSGCGSGGAWANKTSTSSWVLAQTNATATVFVKYKDAAGNESACISASIIHDNIAPTFTVTSSFDGREANMTISISPTDANSVSMKISASASFGSASYQTFSSSYSMPYTKNIKIQLKDAAENESSIVDYTVTYTPTLSQARQWLSATTVGTKAIFAGGYSGSGGSNVVDIYDSVANTWAVATLSQARGYLSATTVGTKAIFAGGSPNSGYSNAVEIYDSSNNSWSTATLSQARSDLSPTTVGTKAIFAGGLSYSLSDAIDIYDSSNNTWSTATLSQARSDLSATTVGTKAIFAGGSATTSAIINASNIVDIFDSVANTWSTSTLSQARAFLAATTVGTKAIFAGGMTNGSIASNVVDIYDSSNNTWSTATLSQAREFLAATTVGTKAIFAGGYNASGGSNVVDIYDSSNNTWSTATLSQGRGSLAATTVGTKAFIVGGSGPSQVIDVYDSVTNTWSTDL